MTRLPAYEITTRKIQGSPHTSHTLRVNGQVVRSQLAPFSPAEIESHVRTHSLPAVPSRTENVAEFLAADKKALARAARGGRRKTVNARGFLWVKEDE